MEITVVPYKNMLHCTVLHEDRRYSVWSVMVSPAAFDPSRFDTVVVKHPNGDLIAELRGDDRTPERLEAALRGAGCTL